MLSTKSENPLITWARQVVWQIKIGISPLSRDLPTILVRMVADKSFCSRGHVTNKKRHISTSAGPYCTKLEMAMAYEKGSPPTMVTWYNSLVMNKKSYITNFTWFMTTKLDKVMAFGTGPPCTKPHDSLITWLYVVSWQIKNVLSPIPQISWTPTLTEYWLMTWDQPQKITSLLLKSSFRSWMFFHLRIIPLIFYRAIIW